jgi:hypothetical protein
MQPRAPAHTISRYDPKHEPLKMERLDTGRYRNVHAEYNKMIINEAHKINLTEKDFPSPYKQEQFEALAAAIEEMDRQKPLRGDNKGNRKKRKCRDAAIAFARQRSRAEAIARAIYGGLPKDALRAVETLIFG